MNNNRRNKLKELIKKIEIIKGELGSILSDEENDFDSMPENLQGSMNGMNSEEAIDKMNEAIESIEEVVESIEEII